MKNSQNTCWVAEKDFDNEVMIRKQLVLVAFLAPWSQPCRTMEAILDKVSTACGEMLKTIKVNADEHPALSLLYDVQSVPTLLYFFNGIIRERTVGTVTPDFILSILVSIATEESHSVSCVTENKSSK